VFDASSLIEIERKRFMSQLRRRHSEVVVPQKVADEVGGKGTPLGRFIRSYPDVVTRFQASEGYEFLRIRSQVGIHDGEAAAIAVALSRDFPLVIEDKRGRTRATSHGVTCLGWREFVQ
jgi:predicted nucleic acid-binding protein